MHKLSQEICCFRLSEAGYVECDWELSDVVCGHIKGRESDQEITLFESQGVAITDVAQQISFTEKLSMREWAGLPLDA
ncbi:MAG: hypothetical protein CM1200mP39_23640 [Dehalococcoidia bacterium]|nr:MAG: hypothetical protein CM1200mP39_23640 [Dehalococcoidia bacterium]